MNYQTQQHWISLYLVQTQIHSLSLLFPPNNTKYSHQIVPYHQKDLWFTSRSLSLSQLSKISILSTWDLHKDTNNLQNILITCMSQLQQGQRIMLSCKSNSSKQFSKASSRRNLQVKTILVLLPSKKS